jgi:hypothetical protein
MRPKCGGVLAMEKEQTKKPQGRVTDTENEAEVAKPASIRPDSACPPGEEKPKAETGPGNGPKKEAVLSPLPEK